jgi:hypothetical protein
MERYPRKAAAQRVESLLQAVGPSVVSHNGHPEPSPAGKLTHRHLSDATESLGVPRVSGNGISMETGHSILCAVEVDRIWRFSREYTDHLR